MATSASNAPTVRFTNVSISGGRQPQDNKNNPTALKRLWTQTLDPKSTFRIENQVWIKKHTKGANGDRGGRGAVFTNGLKTNGWSPLLSFPPSPAEAPGLGTPALNRGGIGKVPVVGDGSDCMEWSTT